MSSAVEGLFELLELRMTVALHELIAWREANAARIAAVSTAPESDRQALLNTLWAEAMAPQYRALEVVSHLGLPLH